MNFSLIFPLFLQVCLFLVDFVNADFPTHNIPIPPTAHNPEHPTNNNPEANLEDLRCSKIRDCFNPPGYDKEYGHGRVNYCPGFPTYKVHVWEREQPLTLNTCCLPDEDDGNYGGWSFSSNTQKGYCYCCDTYGTTCGDSHCARYTSGPPEKLSGDKLVFYNSSTMDEGEKGRKGGILFRKGKNYE